jgi:sugar phosphate permease
MSSLSSPPPVSGRAAPPAGLRPTRARDIAVLYTIVLAVITYIDRVCISMAGPAIQKELFLTPIQMGWVFSVFGWSYALF